MFYSILPEYAIGTGADEHRDGNSPLDVMRNNVNLFLQVRCKQAIDNMDGVFEQQNRFLQGPEKLYRRSNYLNNIRAPRFIIMSLSNLLWNLEHPVNATGRPLTAEQSIELCKNAEVFLNNLLDERQSTFLHKISKKSNQLKEFIGECHEHVKSLRNSFELQMASEVNVADIANAAHSALQVMDVSLFKLVYSRKDRTLKTNIGDDEAAKKIASSITEIDRYLTSTPDFIEKIYKYVEGPGSKIVPKGAGMNTPMSTTVDVLIFLAHLSTSQREHFLHYFKKSYPAAAPSTDLTKLCEEMKNFHKIFVAPIQMKIEKEPKDKLTKTDSANTSTAVRAARRLVPFLSLVIGDLAKLNQSPKDSKDTPQTSFTGSMKKIKMDMDEQLDFIGSSTYYTWDLLTIGRGISDQKLVNKLEELPKLQYRMTQITKMIDSINVLTKEYKSCLTDPAFIEFLKQCLTRVSTEIERLQQVIAELSKYLLSHTENNRDLLSVLNPMSLEFTSQTKAVSAAIAQLRTVVEEPGFNAKQKRLIASKYAEIGKQYVALFGEHPNYDLTAAAIRMMDQSTPAAPVSDAGEEPIVRKASPALASDEPQPAATHVSAPPTSNAQREPTLTHPLMDEAPSTIPAAPSGLQQRHRKAAPSQEAADNAVESDMALKRKALINLITICKNAMSTHLKDGPKGNMRSSPKFAVNSHH